MESIDINTDVEMFSLRRSSRIVERDLKRLEEVKVSTVVHIKTKKARTKRSKAATIDVVLPIDGGVVKKRVSKKKKTTIQKRIKVDKFANLVKSKISDLFSLVHKYAKTLEEKTCKYTILQMVLKNLKELDISNKVVHLYANKKKIEHFVFLKLQNISIIDIHDHISDILAYGEIDDIDAVATNNTNVGLVMDSIVPILTSVQNDREMEIAITIQRVDDINAMICRLMV
jgi:hypothetical protein